MTEWIIICNPKHYDFGGAFRKFNKLNWKQSTNVAVGDIVYIYVGKPFSRIFCKCKVNKTELNNQEIDDSEFVINGENFQEHGRYMEIEMLDKFSCDGLGLEDIKEHGCKSVQGSSKVTQELHDYLEDIIFENQEVNVNIKDRITSYIPYVKKFEKIGREQEILRTKFINDYNMLSIQKLSLEDYVIGINKNSFCNRLENELDDLGSIKGATAIKFGIYFGKLGKDKTQKYRIAEGRYGTNLDIAFEKIKQEIMLLYIAGENKDIRAIELSNISPIVKSKLLSIYHPDKYISIFSKEHLDYFLNMLKIKFDFTTTEVEKQILILDWYYNNPEISHWSIYAFYRFLYKELGNPSDMKEETKTGREDSSLIEDLKVIEIDETKLAKYEYVPKDKPKGKYKNEKKVFQRERKTALNALYMAGYQCELGREHPSFIRRNSDINYTEPHHLIPMAFQDMFDYSLDVEANIVSLCSNCHNKIHYGEGAKEMLMQLYDARKDALDKAGIMISKKKLLSLYLLK